METMQWGLSEEQEEIFRVHQETKKQEIAWAEGLTEGGVLIQLATAGSFLYDSKMHKLFIFPHPKQLKADIIRMPDGYEIREKGFTTPIFEICLDEIWEGSLRFKNVLLKKIREMHRVL